MELFERATREQYRFASDVGELTTEQLWDLPLTGKGGKADLDRVARAVHQELKGLEETSFVEVKPDPRKAVLASKLEVVKHIITVRMTEKAEAVAAAEKAETKRKLLAALDAKRDQKMQEMTEDQIRAALASL